MKILEINKKSIFVCGDIHGEFDTFFNKIKRGLKIKKLKDVKEDVHPLVEEERNAKLTESHPFGFGYDSPFSKSREYGGENYSDSLIVVCGDCGFGFNKEQYYIDKLSMMNELMKLNKTIIVMIRGNHDDPRYFKENVLDFSNIILVDDYTVIKTKKFNLLCIGGGLSIDRMWRKQQEIRINKYKKDKKSLFWENEMPIFDIDSLNEINDNKINIDCVISHTAPSFALPTNKDSEAKWFMVDERLKDDSIAERKVMDDVYEFIKSKEHDLKVWCYGHFHSYFCDTHDDVLFQCNDELSIFNLNDLINIQISNKNKSKKEYSKKEVKEFESSLLKMMQEHMRNGRYGGMHNNAVRYDPVNFNAIRAVRVEPRVINNEDVEPVELRPFDDEVNVDNNLELFDYVPNAEDMEQDAPNEVQHFNDGFINGENVIDNELLF